MPNIGSCNVIYIIYFVTAFLDLLDIIDHNSLNVCDRLPKLELNLLAQW